MEEEKKEEVVLSDSDNGNYRTYKERWLFLANITLINAGCFMISYAFGPISVSATEYYEVTGDEIDLIQVSPWVIYIPGLWIAIWLIERYELLISIRIAASVCSLGALIRILGTFPAYNQNIEPKTQFWITFAGQVVMSFGYPIIITMCTKTSQVWFPLTERPLSTAILGLASILGGVCGQAFGPLIAGEDKADNVPWINICFSIPIFAGLIITWLLIRRPKPKTPPSRSAELLLERDPPTFKHIMRDLKKLVMDPTTLVLGMCEGMGAGMTNVILSQLNQMMCSRNYTISQSSLGAILFIVAGISGGLTLGPLARKHRLQEEFGKGGVAITCAFCIALVICLNRYDLFVPIAIFLALYGMFGIASYPMNMELMIEHSFPMDAVMGECFIHTWSQISGIVLIVLGNTLYNDLPDNAPNTCSDLNSPGGVEARDYTPYYYFVMAIGTAVAFALIFLVHPKLRRTNADNADREENRMLYEHELRKASIVSALSG